MKDMRASAMESRPSANRVKLPVYVEIETSAIPIANRVYIESQAALRPSWKAVDEDEDDDDGRGLFNK